MRLVLVESPFAFKHVDLGVRAVGLTRNIAYARAACRDCCLRREAPYASHLFYTQPGILDDDADERAFGIDAGLSWGASATASMVYRDLGISSGMSYGMRNAEKAGREIVMRTLPGWTVGEDDHPGEILISLGLATVEEIVAMDPAFGRRNTLSAKR